MDRRHFLLGAGAGVLLPRAAWAHHGWGGYDAAVPVYLAGTVKRARWDDPHANLVIAVSPTLALPAGLAARVLPAQRAAVDGADILRRAVLPSRKSAEWTIELCAPALLKAQGREAIPAGDAVEVVGYLLRMGSAPPYLAAEYLFHAGKVYAMRSESA